MAIDSKPYLEYLDKEMNIMGILSVFCVGVLAIVIDKIAGAKDTALASLWAAQSGHWVTGSAALLIAAWFFYLQRSRLAWYYGQIALTQIGANASTDHVRDWLRNADSWDTWIRYQFALESLVFGFWQFGVAVAQQELQTSWSNLFTGYLPFGALLVVGMLRSYVLRTYRYHDEPWNDWRHRVTPCGIDERVR